MLSAAEPARVTVGAAAILPVALKALSPARVRVDAAVRLVVELSADAAFRTLSGSAASDELAVRLEVVRMTTKRPTAVELNARSMLADTSTGGCDEPTTVKSKPVEVDTSTASFDKPTTLKSKPVEVDTSTASFDELVSPKSRSMLALTFENTSAATVTLVVELKALSPARVMVEAAVMLPDAVRLAAPLSDKVDA